MVFCTKISGQTMSKLGIFPNKADKHNFTTIVFMYILPPKHLYNILGKKL